MGPRKLGPITIGIAGAAGTSGIAIMVSRLGAGQGSAMDTCFMLATSFITTSLIAALGLILSYRLGKLALQAQASAAQRSAELSKTRLELQRAVLDKVQDSTNAAEAYQKMTAADALYAFSHPELATDETAPVALVRDIKDRDGGTLALTAQAWRAFVSALKD